MLTGQGVIGVHDVAMDAFEDGATAVVAGTGRGVRLTQIHDFLSPESIRTLVDQQFQTVKDKRKSELECVVSGLVLVLREIS